MVNFWARYAQCNPGATGPSPRPRILRQAFLSAVIQLLGCSPFGRMTQGMPFDEAVEFFGKVFGMVAGAFEGLGHEQDIKAERIPLAYVVGQVPLEQGMADSIKFRV